MQNKSGSGFTLVFRTLTFLVICASLLASSCRSKNSLVGDKLQGVDNEYTLLSFNLLEQVKANKNTTAILDQLAKLNVDTLAQHLQSDEQKKAFWINIYNAHIQVFLSADPSLFENRSSFFSKKRIRIAQTDLSFDDIEHGIIRGSEFKLALGLVKNPFAGKFEKQFRVKRTDGRIHFALNCGAKSCPVVALYSAQNFNSKLDVVAKSFLEQVCRYDSEKDELILTPLFSWFRGDFNGKSGILSLLEGYGIIPKGSKPGINYDSYDWTLSLGNYYEEEND